MKFVLDHDGVLVPVKESRVTEVVKLHSKPLIKTVFYGAAFYIGYHLLQFFLTGGLPGLDFAFHEIIELLGFGTYFKTPFVNAIQAKSF